jgi:prepilin-type N-terminal cleavage/methylation domain-containing protein
MTKREKMKKTAVNRPKGREKGFSILELTVALLIFAVVLTSVYTLFESQSRSLFIQDQVSEMAQSARAAANMMMREVRMAGYHALGNDLINNLSTFVPSNFIPSGPLTLNLDTNPKITAATSTDPDMITFLAVLDSDTNPTTIASQGSATTITLNLTSAETGAQYNVNDIIHIGYASEYAKVTAISGNTLTIDTNPNASGNQGLTETYAAGMPIGEISVVTYAVFNQDNDASFLNHSKGHPALKRKINEGNYETVAENITDMQVVSVGSGEIQLRLSARTDMPDSKFPVNGGYRTYDTDVKLKIRNASSVGTGSNCGLPAAPANVAIDSGQSLNASYPCKINLSWDAVTTDSAGNALSGGCVLTGYRVFWDTTPGGNANSIDVGNVTSYEIDVSGTQACTYYVTVAALNSGGAGTKSGEQSIMDAEAPSTPTMLTATSGADSNRVDLSWNFSLECDVTGYDIYRGVASGGPYTKTTAEPLSEYTHSYIDYGLLGCRTYYYVIKALDSCPNTSAASSEVSVTAADTIPPGMPTGLTYAYDPVNLTDTLTWTVSADDGAGMNDVVGYNIYGDGSLITTLGAGSTVFTQATPSPRTIIYGVSAEDQYCGNESEAAEVSTCDQNATISITSPSGSDALTGTVAIQGIVTGVPEGRSISSVQIRIDSDQWITPTGALIWGAYWWSYNWDTTLVPNGPHTVTAKVTDSTGCFHTATATLTVDNTVAPENQLYVSVYHCKKSGNKDIYVRVYIRDQDGNTISDADITAVTSTGIDAFGEIVPNTQETYPGFYGGDDTPDCGELSCMDGQTESGDGLSVKSVQKFNSVKILFTVSKEGYADGTAVVSY